MIKINESYKSFRRVNGTLDGIILGANLFLLVDIVVLQVVVFFMVIKLV